MRALELAARRLPLDAARRLARIEAALPLLYLAWVMPLVLVIAMVTPPWQNPDEAAHMLRIVQIALGGLMGYRFDHDAGGVSDPAILQSLLTVYGIFGHPEHKVTLGLLANAGAVPWGKAARIGFANTAQYSPVFYVPAVLAVEGGRLLHLTVVHTLIAARIANGLTSGLIATLALTLARRTRLALGVLLLLPMTVALFASAAQDALMIAVAVAVIAGLDRILHDRRDPTGWESILVAVGIVTLILGRPTNLPFAALLLMCAGRSARGAWIGAAAVAAIGIAWTAYVCLDVAVPLSPANVPGAQLQHILHAPWSIVSLAANTLAEQYGNYRVSFIGVLGSLDTRLPDAYYAAASFGLVLAFGSAAAGPARRAWVALLIVLASAAALFAAAYLVMTAPGADQVDGVQGRYFLPLAAVFCLAMPSLPRIGGWLRPAATAVLLALAAVTPMVIVHALVLRYYLTM